MDTNNAEKWFEYARQQVRQNNNTGAIESLRRALSLDPDFSEAHALLSLVLLDQRRIYAAKHEAQLALALSPESPVSRLAEAQVLVAQRQFKQAETCLRQLLALDPQNSIHYRLLATIFSLTSRNQHIPPLLDKALELDPEDPDTLVAYGQYHLEQDDLNRAGVKAWEALHVQAEHYDALILMGYVFLQYNEIEEAQEHALWALRQDPENPKALYLIAAIKARTSPFLGFWWRSNAWLSSFNKNNIVIILVVAFMIYRIMEITAQSFGQPEIAMMITGIWLAIVAYSWVGPVFFYRMLKKELANIQLRKDF